MCIKIRRLSERDRNNVKEISRHIWDGHDYLGVVVNEWLKDPACHFYGVEAGGHIVAVGNLRLIECGRTGWMEGLRVHPEHRGKGYANEITQYLVKEAGRLRINRLRYTTADENTASLKLAKMAGFSRLLEMAVFWGVNLRRIPSIHSNLETQEASPARVFRVLKAHGDIVPHSVLIYDWKALDCALKNLKEIGRSHRFCISLKDGDADSVSFGYPRPEPNQAWWSFTVYACDSESFRSQLVHHMSLALRHGFRSVTGTFENKFEKTLRALNIESEEQGTTHLVLLEKEL